MSIHNFCYIILLLACTSCSLTRGLPEGQKIYKSTSINFTPNSTVAHKDKLKTELLAQSILQPITGLNKARVNIHNNNNKKNKTKGFAFFFKSKVGIPPVLYNPTAVQISKSRIEKYLLDQGYFSATVTVDSTLGHRKVLVNYTIDCDPRYKIRKFENQFDSLFSHQEQPFSSKDLLDRNKKKYYSKDLLDQVRTASVTRLKDLGYYKINEQNFYFVVDTTVGNRQVDIYNKFAFKDSTEAKKYYFGSSIIYPDYSLSQESDRPPQNYKGLDIVSNAEILKPKFLNTLIWDEQGQEYNKSSEQLLLQRFLSTNLFKFVNQDYEEWNYNDSLFLDRYLYLTPKQMRRVNLDLQLNNISGNIFGSQIGGGFTHYNLFKGAENLRLTAAVNGEFQTGNQNTPGVFNTLDYQISANLGLPGIRVPFFKARKIKGGQLPRTQISLSDQIQNRRAFYTVNSIKTALSYVWNKKEHRHSFTPLSINYVDLIRSSMQLEDLIAQNSRLRESFEDLFILSIGYKHNFSKQFNKKSQRLRSISISSGIETAGNLSRLLSNGVSQTGAKTILGIPYSQYAKFDLDIRPGFKFRKGQLATRLVLGIGIPYGNSSVLPYIKQYVVGGSNSMRAFDLRTLGPGSFESNIAGTGNDFVDQTGDIQLEMNVEYRFPIVSIFDGAFFVDVGNIWLARKDKNAPAADASVFQWQNFYKQFGIGTGFGFRVDLNLAILRADIALPVRDPRNKDPWVITTTSLSDLKLRLGIGYPF